MPSVMGLVPHHGVAPEPAFPAAGVVEAEAEAEVELLLDVLEPHAARASEHAAATASDARGASRRVDSTFI
jgi:hypothetical protein